MKQQLENHLYSEIDSMFSQRIDLEIEEVEEIGLYKMKIINKELLSKETNEQQILEFMNIKNQLLSKNREVEKEIVVINKIIEDARDILNDLEIAEDYKEIRRLSFDLLEETMSDLEYVTWGVEKAKTESYIFTGNGTVEAQMEYVGAEGDYYILNLDVDFDYKVEELQNKKIKVMDLEITNCTTK